MSALWSLMWLRRVSARVIFGRPNYPDALRYVDHGDMSGYSGANWPTTSRARGGVPISLTLADDECILNRDLTCIRKDNRHHYERVVSVERDGVVVDYVLSQCLHRHVTPVEDPEGDVVTILCLNCDQEISMSRSRSFCWFNGLSTQHLEEVYEVTFEYAHVAFWGDDGTRLILAEPNASVKGLRETTVQDS